MLRVTGVVSPSQVSNQAVSVLHLHRLPTFQIVQQVRRSVRPYYRYNVFQ